MASLTVPFRPDNISTGLLTYWKFNNGATDTQGTYDLTGSGTPAYAVDSFWKDGEYSCDLNGATPMYFTRADAAPLDLVDAFTIAGWIKADDITGTTIVDKGSETTGYSVQIDASSKIVLFMNNGARATSATAISAEKWHHFACVYDQATARVYLDGNLDISSAYSTDCQATTTDLFIGVQDNGSSAPYDGHIKDLAIWSAALTPLQVKSLALGVDLSKYTYRPNHVSTQPTHWWKLNEVSGNRADSVATNPLTLTDTNTVLSSGGYVEGVAADFERTSTEYFLTADSADWDITADFTLSGWYKLESSGSNALWEHYQDGSNYWYLAFDSNILTFRSHNGTTDSNIIQYTKTLDLETWFHIAVRRSGNTWKVFLDGIEVDSDTSSVTPHSGSGNLNIGYSAKLTQAFDGEMQDVAIWKGYALTDAEIKSLACALPIQRQGIVSYWKLADVNDSIGTNHFTDAGIAGFVAGKVGNAADFEATGSKYLSLANNDSIDIVSDMAILGWYKPESVDVEHQILDKDSTGDGYGILIGVTNRINFTITSDNDVSATSVAAGTWSHFAGNYDGALKAMYFNGAIEGNGAYSTSAADTTTEMRLGSTVAGGSYADGVLDELVLSKRYFRPEEIKAVYLKGLNGKEITTSERKPKVIQSILID